MESVSDVVYLEDSQRVFKAEATGRFHGIPLLLESFLDRFQALAELREALGLQQLRQQHSGQRKKASKLTCFIFFKDFKVCLRCSASDLTDTEERLKTSVLLS